ncbi:PBECR2 nuclease fold domain-containing protein, partial [Campylobacter upsaliensis]
AIVEIPADLKERLGKEIKLNKKDFEKLMKNKREKYIPQIKETFKEPEAVFIDENDDLIFTKTFNDKLFFVNVNRDYGEAFKALSLAPKKNNNLLNKLNKAKEILKLDSKLRDYTAQQAFTGVLSASNKSSGEIIPQIPKDNSQLNVLHTKIQQVRQQIAESKNPDKEYLHQVFKPDEIIELEKQYFNQAMPQEYKELIQDFPQLYEQRLANELKEAYVKDTDVIQEVSAQLLNDFKDKSFKDTAKHAELLLFNTLRDKAQELGFKELDINEPSFKVAFGKFQAKLKKGDIQDLSEHIAINSLQHDRLRIQEALNLTPLKEFGTNYAEFYRDGKGAVEKLLKEAEDFKQRGEKGEFKGQVAGAFYKEGLGEIDLVWGDKNYGLRHILEQRTKQWGEEKALKFISHLNENIEKGQIVEVQKGRAAIKTDLTTIILDKKENNNFVLTELIDKRNKKRLEAMQTGVGDSFKDEPLAKTPLSQNQQEIIPQQKIKFAMEKFNYDEKKAKDLLEWHKNSHALTKDENGLPKVFYHGTYSKFRVFRRVGKASQQGFFFTPSQKATEEYGDITLNTFLNIKNPFRADELKINKEADLQKWADILKLDYDKEKYESFKDLKTKLEKVKEATKKAGFKFHSASGGGVYVIDNKGRNSFINLEELDKENKRVVEAFKGLETEDIYFYYVVRNEFDLVLYALNKNDRYFHTSGRDEVKRVLEKLGYDGAVLNDTIITVFNSNQIKHIDNKGSFTDTKGNVTSKKPKDKEVEFSYFNEKSDNIYHSNPHLGAGLVGGVLNGVEQDENGNLSFDPVKFAMGFLGGAAGSKAVKESIKWRANKVKKAYPNIAKNNPTLMEQIAKRDLLTYAKNETQNALTRLLNKNKLFDSTKGLFAGEKALLNEAYAPHKARLEKAKELEGSGADEIEIWEKTGWYKDKDHKWKFEISQRGGELDLAKIKDKDSEAKLGEILKDDELFKAYPQLRDMSVKHVDLSGNYGFYYVPYNDIKLVRPHIQLDIDEIKTSPYKVKEVLYHEIQHAIQHKEQFAYGLSYMAETYERYLKQHGEVEARNIQERMKNPTKIHPHKTMDTDIEDTIAESALSTEYSEAFSRKLEKSFLDESERIAYKSLMQNAEKLPKELNLRAFKEQFKGQKYAIIKTPIKDVKINTDYAFYHLLKSGNGKENRKYISGGILATLQNPLFVTKDERGSYYFYKPFKINENLINLVSVEVDKNDKLLYKTSYEASKNKLKSMIEKYDLIYFAGGIQPVRAE